MDVDKMTMSLILYSQNTRSYWILKSDPLRQFFMVTLRSLKHRQVAPSTGMIINYTAWVVSDVEQNFKGFVFWNWRNVMSLYKV